jgi:hypothetical protein
VTWVRQYIGYAGPLPACGPADFIKRPLDWTLGGFTPVMTFFSNVQLAANLVIPLGLLPCKHFPQMSIPACWLIASAAALRAIEPAQRVVAFDPT